MPDEEIVQEIKRRLDDLVDALNLARERKITVSFSIGPVPETEAGPLVLSMFKAVKEYT